MSDPSTSRLTNAIAVCDNMRPSLPTVDSNNETFDKMRADLARLNPTPTATTKMQLRKSDERKLEESVRELCSEIGDISSKLKIIASTLTTFIDKFQDFEERISALESRSASSSPASYAQAVQSIPISEPSASSRIEKLEFISSENERRNRLLHVTLTHPSIDPEHTDLKLHVREFLTTTLQMASREIDANMIAQKTPRPNTIQLKLSDRRFKNFLFAARKKLRNLGSSTHGTPGATTENDELYINENLTTYNYLMLKKLKEEKRARATNGSANFYAVYTFEGKVFAKVTASQQSTDATHIKNPSALVDFLTRVDSQQIL